jgi:hypothetical protein
MISAIYANIQYWRTAESPVYYWGKQIFQREIRDNMVSDGSRHDPYCESSRKLIKPGYMGMPVDDALPVILDEEGKECSAGKSGDFVSKPVGNLALPIISVSMMHISPNFKTAITKPEIWLFRIRTDISVLSGGMTMLLTLPDI